MPSLFRNPYLIILVSGIAYLTIGYLVPRSDLFLLLSVFACLFAAYYRLTQTDLPVWTIIIAAILLRLLFIPALPNLSDDYFRFIWDGRLWTQGINPFKYLPSELITDPAVPGIHKNLLERLNSPDYYSVYPPVCQYLFGLASALFPENMLANVGMLRLFIITAEAVNLLLIVRLLRHFHLPEKDLSWYAFNPLVIVELSGNLHFEAIMITFVLLALYLLIRQKTWLSAVMMGLGIGVKLLPLIFLPLLIRRIGWKRALGYGAITGLTVGILFVPFMERSLLTHLFSSINLYFQSFEFNASIYYLIREAGYLAMGYNIIQTAGIVLSVVTALGILALAYYEREPSVSNLPQTMLGAMVIYFLLATVVHPWYITTLVMLAGFTAFRSPILWSALVVLSYAAYRQTPYEENLWLVLLEYSLFGAFAIYEWKKHQKPASSSSSDRNPAARRP